MVVSAVLVASAVACSPGEDDGAIAARSVAPMYEEEFRRKLSGEFPDKVRTVLADYWVTDEEWNDLVNDYLVCMESLGSEGYVAADHLNFGVSERRQEEINRVNAGIAAFTQLEIETDYAWDCAEPNIRPVGELYFGPRGNPEGLSWPEALQRCYKEAGLDELDGLTQEEILELTGQVDYDIDDPPARRSCLDNPSYSN